MITCSSIMMTEPNLAFSGNSSFDEPNWEPTFDHNDDTDSIWGFNPSTTKVSQNFPYTFPFLIATINVIQNLHMVGV